MNYFDCHCDTLTLMDPARDTLYSNSLFIDLKRVSAFADRYTQIYAIFDDVAETPESARDARFEQLYDQARAYLSAQEDRIALVTSAAEMHAAHDEGRAAAFLSVEDVSVMGGHVDELYDRGFRFCMLAWNHDNVYACGADFDQRRGLTQR
ncbi:MAG: membrane dipeptidase, partial [Coriobacteriaceae bacterium]|nr:membrane dipeptidase [Coriobacteriaceae bacterium]